MANDVGRVIFGSISFGLAFESYHNFQIFSDFLAPLKSWTNDEDHLK